jgi:streptogramin lyase
VTTTPFEVSIPYFGTCIDSNGNVWVTSLWGGVIRKYDPKCVLLGSFSHGDQTAQGCVVSTVDGMDHVWVAHSAYGSTVVHLLAEGTWIGIIEVGDGPTGVAVDRNGKIWSANFCLARSLALIQRYVLLVRI